MAQSAGLALPSTNDIIKGTITRVISPTNFITSLVGYGDNFFQDWDVYIVKVTSGSGFAPQGDRVQCNLYTSKKGEISLIRAFDTSTPAIGDTIFMMHPFYGQNSLIVDVPSNDLKQSSDEKVSTAAIVLTQVAALAWTGKVGGCRVKFDMRITPAGTASAVIYKNGVPVVSNPGTTPNYTIHTNALNTFVTFSQDIYGLAVGDIIQIYAMTGGAGTTEIQNFRIYYDLTHLASVEATTEAVFYDEENGVSGTDWPIGTVRMPSNNYTDTMAIAAERNIHKITIIGGGTFTISTDFTMAIEGSSYCDVTINAGVTANLLGNLICKNFTIEGILNLYGDIDAKVLYWDSPDAAYSYVYGNVNVSKTFSTYDNSRILIYGNLSAERLAHYSFYIDITGNVEIAEALICSGTYVSKTVSARYIQHEDSIMRISGDCFCHGDSGLLFSLRVGGTGLVRINGNLFCKAEIYGIGLLEVSGNVFCEAIIDATGLLNITVNGNLYCHGASTFNFNSILSVDGHAEIHALVNNGTGDLTFNGGLECFGGLTAMGDFYVLGDCIVTGDIFCNDDVIVYGDFKGNKFVLAGATVSVYGNVSSENGLIFDATTATITGDVSANSLVLGAAAAAVTIRGDTTARFVVDTFAGSTLTIHGYLDNFGADAILGTATYKERPLHMMDFWSLPEDAITITSAAADITLPDVVVADLPAQSHVVRVVALFKFRAMENSNVAANKINGAQKIQVDDSAATGWLDAINLIDDEFALAASTREWGEIVIGSANVATRVDANDTYSFQWNEALADVDSLIFNDIQVGLRIWYR